MGGLALHAAGYSRATQDIDVLILKEDMPKIKRLLENLGYELIHESEDVSNFKGLLQELGQIDFLHAHRRYTKNMLKRAQKCAILNGTFQVNVLIPEDIIGLKLQAIENDNSRKAQDIADIEWIIKKHRQSLDVKLLTEYFKLFGKSEQLKELLNNAK